MTRVVSILVVSLIAGVVSACGTATSPDPPLPATFTLAPGQEVVVGSLAIRFTGVTSDSRCPGDAICIQAGDVTAAFAASAGKAPAAFELHRNDTRRNAATVGAYVVELTEVTPYPFASLPPIPPSDYRAAIVVSRR